MDIKNYVTDQNIYYIASLYGIIVPPHYKTEIEEKNFIMNELSQLDPILSRGAINMPDFYNQDESSYVEKSKFYTLTELISDIAPIKIYEWNNREELCKKAFIMLNKLKQICGNMEFKKNILDLYYDKIFEWQNILYNEHIFNIDCDNKEESRFLLLNNPAEETEYISFDMENVKTPEFEYTLEPVLNQDFTRSNILTEIMFLQKYSNDIKNVIMIKDSNLSIFNINKLFPTLTFHVIGYPYNSYDNVKFYKNIDQFNTSVPIIPNHMLILKLNNHNEMNAVCETFKPTIACLHTKIYQNEILYKGFYFLPPWISNLNEFVIITNCEYKEKCNYENIRKILRNHIVTAKCCSLYNHNIKNDEIFNYDHCYDCKLEIEILKNYSEYIQSDNVEKQIGELKYIISIRKE